MASNFITWLSAFSSCSTIFMQADKAFKIIDKFQDRSLVISDERPWSNLELETSDCSIIIASSFLSQNVTKAVELSRNRIDVVFLDSKESPFPVDELSTPKTEVKIGVVKLNKITVIESVSFSPFNSKGKAKQRSMRASFIFFPPFITKPDPANPTGVDADTLITICQRLGIHVKFERAKSFDDNVARVADGRSDMTIAQATISPTRASLGLDYHVMLFRNLHYAQRHPVPVDSVYTILYPFPFNIWVAIFATIFVLILSFSVMNRYHDGHHSLDFKTVSIAYIPLISESVPLTWYSQRSKNQFFMVFFLWLLVATLLSQFYESNLLASLVKVDLEKQPQTSEEFLETDIGVYTVQGSALGLFLKYSPFEVHRRVFDKNLEKLGGYYPNAFVPKNIIDLIKAGEAVTLLSSDVMSLYKHNVVLAKEQLVNSPVGYYFPMKLPLRHEIKWGLRALQETGVVQEMSCRTDWSLSKPWRDLQRTRNDNQKVAIGASHLIALFSLFAIGIAVTLVVFAFEWTKARCRRYSVYLRRRNGSNVSQALFMQSISEE